jgi:hypothetical protein
MWSPRSARVVGFVGALAVAAGCAACSWSSSSGSNSDAATFDGPSAYDATHPDASPGVDAKPPQDATTDSDASASPESSSGDASSGDGQALDVRAQDAAGDAQGQDAGPGDAQAPDDGPGDASSDAADAAPDAAAPDAAAPDAAVTPTVLASNLFYPSHPAVNSVGVYYLFPGNPAIGSTDGAVMMVPINGGSPVTIASGQIAPVALAVDSVNVLWFDNGNADAGFTNSSLLRASLDGSAASVLGSGISVDGVAAGGGNLYWTQIGVNGNGSVFQLSAGAATPLLLGSGSVNADDAIGVAVDTSYVYWVNQANGYVMRAPIDGGSLAVLYPGPGYSGGVSVDSNNVYWTSEGSSAGGGIGLDGGAFVMQASKFDGGGAIAIATAPNPYGTDAGAYLFETVIAGDSSGVYYIVGGDLMRVPVGGGSPVKLASSTTGVALDATYVYWTFPGTAANGYHDGAIYRLAK